MGLLQLKEKVAECFMPSKLFFYRMKEKLGHMSIFFKVQGVHYHYSNYIRNVKMKASGWKNVTAAANLCKYITFSSKGERINYYNYVW